MLSRERGLDVGKPEKPGKAAAPVEPPVGRLQGLDALDGIQVCRVRSAMQDDGPIRNPERTQSGGPTAAPVQRPQFVERDFQHRFAIGGRIEHTVFAKVVKIFQPECVEQVLS
ncbi:hypothetical protein V3O24_16180 [Methylobacter sp. Wu8]|uniref:hypothetical protein n=1 Tax=Methylobacter sp. Wu8 TaxID=3118457 RepID=UPI002F2F7BFD